MIQLLRNLDETLLELCCATSVPGVSIGILHGGRFVTASAGVLNLNTDTDAPVCVETIFQIGSITKVFTTLLALQLVEDGVLQLDEPIDTYVPELRPLDCCDDHIITLRRLLSHTSGLDGDLFLDLGVGEEALTAYIAKLNAYPPLHASGERFSYCNAGFVVAARAIERALGVSWETAMRQRLLQPMQIDDAIVLPGDSVSAPVAWGHVEDVEDPTCLVPQGQAFALPATVAAVGSTLSMRASSVLQLALLQMNEGVTSNGKRILSQTLCSEMIQPQIDLPSGAPAGTVQWGLGWALYDWNGARLYGHDGDTIGFLSFMRIHPESGTAVAILTNGGMASNLADKIFAKAFGELAGIEPPPPPEPVCDACIPPALCVGRYQRLERAIEISQVGQSLFLQMAENESGLAASPQYELHPAGGDKFLWWCPPQSNPFCIQFCDYGEDSAARSLYSGYRLCVRKT